jgi:uncharacterized protein (TIGR00730 family)
MVPAVDRLVGLPDMPELRRICLYAGSSPGADPAYAEAAATLARILAERGIGIAYGGAGVGLMGVLADTAMESGGEVIGVLPRALASREIGHRGLTRLEIVETMHERKARMADLSDAFIALPGGLGTLEEVVEALTWTMLGIHSKPVGLLSVGGYYEPLEAVLDQAHEQGFLRPEHRGIVISDDDPGDLLERLGEWEPVHASRWTPAETPPPA